MLERLAERVNGDERLRRLGRFCTTEFLIEVGDVPYHVAVEQGRIRSVEKGPFRMRSWSFAIRASEASWKAFCAAVPRPGFHDIFAMTSCGHARIEGDMAPLLHNLRYVKEVLATMREKG